MELSSSTAVVVARNFNPSILSQLWLVRQGIVAENDFQQGCMFLDQVSQAETPLFRLTALPQQLHLTPRCPPDDEAAVVLEKLGGIVRALPHTPYMAVGLNFLWHQVTDNIAELTRSLFFQGGSELFEAFDVADARFGAYLSKNWRSLRLKLDIKPIQFQAGASAQDRLLFAFNFHLDLPNEGAVDKIIAGLKLWQEAQAESRRLVELVLRGVGT